MPRFAAIAFSGIALEIARQRLSSERAGGSEGPLAVVVARPGGAVQGEGSLLGNTRLSEVSPEARGCGIRQGETIAAAKAKHGALRVRVVEQAAVQAALVGVAEMALMFGATTSFEAGGAAGDVVWVDVTGCAHLHAREGDPGGERSLGEAIAQAVLAMGHACRVAIADGVRVAAAVARFAPHRPAAAFERNPQEGAKSRRPTGNRQSSAFAPSRLPVLSSSPRCPPLIVPPFSNARAMGRLPLVALGLSSDALGWLSKVGARRVGDLARLPRPGLAARLGHDAQRVMALLEGDDRAPLRPHVPPEKPVERAELEYGITHHEALFFVVKRLCDRLGARLEGRGKRAAKLLLRLEVDHAVAGAPPKDPTLPLTLASPLSRADELFAVVRAKVESPDGAARIAIEHEAGGAMDVPILAVSLEVTEEVLAEGAPQHLFVPEARAERALPRVVAELSAELGAQAVGVLALVDTWVTVGRSRLVPYRASPPSRTGPPLVSAGEEMSRLLPEPKVVPRGALTHLRLVARSELVEWWRPEAQAHDAFVAFWDEGGGQGGRGAAWVSIDPRTGDGLVHGWVD